MVVPVAVSLDIPLRARRRERLLIKLLPGFGLLGLHGGQFRLDRLHLPFSVLAFPARTLQSALE
jgi:hypothetical protein